MTVRITHLGNAQYKVSVDSVPLNADLVHGPIRTSQLTEALVAGIGRVVVEWSAMEQSFQEFYVGTVTFAGHTPLGSHINFEQRKEKLLKLLPTVYGDCPVLHGLLSNLLIEISASQHLRNWLTHGEITLQVSLDSKGDGSPPTYETAAAVYYFVKDTGKTEEKVFDKNYLEEIYHKMMNFNGVLSALMTQQGNLINIPAEEQKKLAAVFPFQPRAAIRTETTGDILSHITLEMVPTEK